LGACGRLVFVARLQAFVDRLVKDTWSEGTRVY